MQHPNDSIEQDQNSIGNFPTFFIEPSIANLASRINMKVLKSIRHIALWWGIRVIFGNDDFNFILTTLHVRFILAFENTIPLSSVLPVET